MPKMPTECMVSDSFIYEPFNIQNETRYQVIERLSSYRLGTIAYCHTEKRYKFYPITTKQTAYGVSEMQEIVIFMNVQPTCPYCRDNPLKDHPCSYCGHVTE